MKKFILSVTLFSLAGILLFTSCGNDDDSQDMTKTITYDELPTKTKTFISDYFNGYNLQKATRNTTAYNVTLTKDAVTKSNTGTTSSASGYDIDFDLNGNWVKVDSHDDSALPEHILTLIPRNIISYILEKYPSRGISEMERVNNQYRIELTGNDDKELFFDVNGSYIGLEDDSDKTPVSTDNLPTLAQTFITTHFSTLSIKSVKKDEDSYDVEFTNNLEIDFDLNGNWTDIDANNNTLPSSIFSLLPSGINSYLQTKYPNTSVEDIEKRISSYKIELANDIELIFDLQGNIWEDNNNSNNNSDDKDRVSIDNLPQAAQTILNNYFLQTATILYIEKDDNEYEIKLSNGTEIDFSASGELIAVEVIPGNSVPDGVIPDNILSYVKSNYSTKLIESFEKKYSGYKIELSGYPEIELLFNLNGNFKGLDD